MSHRPARSPVSGFAMFVGALLVLGFLAATGALVWPAVHGGEPSQIAVYLLGNLTGMALTVVAFLFGSSQGSREKDQARAPGGPETGPDAREPRGPLPGPDTLT